MKVSDLIEKLASLPPDADVWVIYDGAARMEASHAWLTRDGRVAIADFGSTVYYTDDRPFDAPTKEECKYWHTPECPVEESEDD